MESFQVYKDMKARTNGEIYIGVVGPVRTGKSTFIKRFMDLLVLPNMTDIHAKERTQDELPQSASGTTIMTTEPKFVPKEAAGVKLSDDLEVKIRMIDCVGFMSEGASGHIEKDEERQVKTPWFEYEIPVYESGCNRDAESDPGSCYNRDCCNDRRKRYGFAEGKLYSGRRKDGKRTQSDRKAVYDIA